MIYHVRNGIDTLLDGEREFMVVGADVCCHFPGGYEIGGVGQANGEGVELRPGYRSVVHDRYPSLQGRVRSAGQKLSLSLLLLDCGDFLRLTGRDGRNEAAVETTGKQHAVGDFAHQPLLHGHFQSGPERGKVGLGGRRWDDGRVPPTRLVVPLYASGLGVVEVARREGLDVVTFLDESLELGSEVADSGVGFLPSLVECRDADRIACDQDPSGFDGLVQEDEREHSIEHVAQRFWIVFLVLFFSGRSEWDGSWGGRSFHATYKVKNDLAVGMSLEFCLGGKRLLESHVVVDLTIDAEDLLAILADEGLGTGICDIEGYQYENDELET